MEKAVSTDEIRFVSINLDRVEYPYTIRDIRRLDQLLKEKKQRNYYIVNRTEGFDISFSGLDLSLPDKKSLPFVGDTYYVIIDQIDPESEKKIRKVSDGYGFEAVEGIDISFRFNYQNIDLSGPAVVQLDVADKKNDLIYSVYHLDKNGDVIKCRTEQSDHYVQFMIRGSGSYLLLSLPSANEYDIRDGKENLSLENMGSDQLRTSLQILGVLVLSLAGLIGITVYYIVENKRKRLWRDFRRSLREAGIVQEEKPKS